MVILLNKSRRGFLRAPYRLRFASSHRSLLLKPSTLKHFLALVSNRPSGAYANMYVLGQSRANLLRMHECSISKCIPCASKVACTSASDK